MSSSQIEVSRLVAECYAALRSSKRMTRREYYDALTLADSALELALDDGALDGGLVRQCEILQDFCQNSLRSAYARMDRHDRLVYEKAVSARGCGSDSDSDSSAEEDEEVGSGAEL